MRKKKKLTDSHPCTPLASASSACNTYAMDIKNPTVLKLKGMLFLFLGLLSGGMLLALNPTLIAVVLFAISIWAFCRFYYFAFYVLHNYADPNFKYAGLGSLIRYFFTKKQI